MTKPQLEQRLVVAILLLSILGTITSFILQYGFHYEPCPLCIFQRLSVILSTMLALIIFFLPYQKQLLRTWVTLLLLAAIVFGIVAAGRQIYLQSLPADQLPACSPGLNFLLQHHSWTDALAKVFAGSGECAIVEKIAGIPLSLWSLGLLSLMACCALWLLFAPKKSDFGDSRNPR